MIAYAFFCSSILSSAKKMHWLINSFRLISAFAAFSSNVSNTVFDMRIDITSFSGFFGIKFGKVFPSLLLNCILFDIIVPYSKLDIGIRIQKEGYIMSIDSAMYMHEQDKAALKALRTIPGFSPVLKAFMKVWNEQQFHIENMSSNLHIDSKQLSEYYDMLPPICEKLGIDIPELYLTLDVYPNAYTYGDTKPFIVMTSGLLETLPKDLIPSVLAHECGHIACHHTLYTTMGALLINGAIDFLGLGNLISYPLQIAFYYWMRCSEYSADRAAAICDGCADKVIETCMRFSGLDKDIDATMDVEHFMEQAIEYQKMLQDSQWNKALEFAMFHRNTHPLSAVRAYQCDGWQKTSDFQKIQEYLKGSKRELPLLQNAKSYIGRNIVDVLEELRSIGFTNIDLIRKSDKALMTKPGQILHIMLNGYEKFQGETWYPSDCQIVIIYYAPETVIEKS